MRVSANSTIASRKVSVKSTFLGDRIKTKTYSQLKPSSRPDVLSKMPRSCNLVYDVLRTLDHGNGVIRISQRDLANIACYSQRQAGRALKRLQGAKIIRLVEKGKGQRKTAWYLRWNSHKSFPQLSEALTTREVKKELKPTKDKSSFSIEPFKNIPKTQHLNQADKRRLSFVARDTCQPDIVSPVLDILWQRDCCAGVWLSAIQGLKSLAVDALPSELLWRSRQAVAALIGGVTVDKYQAIMLDQVSKDEMIQREVDECERRLAGLRQWRIENDEPDYDSWYVEKRAELQRKLYDASYGIIYDDEGERIDLNKKALPCRRAVLRSSLGCEYRRRAIEYKRGMDKGVAQWDGKNEDQACTTTANDGSAGVLCLNMSVGVSLANWRPRKTSAID